MNLSILDNEPKIYKMEISNMQPHTHVLHACSSAIYTKVHEYWKDAGPGMQCGAFQMMPTHVKEF